MRSATSAGLIHNDKRGGSNKNKAATELSTVQKKASTEPADQRRDYDRGKVRNERNAHNIRIDGDP
jgi:hypothetical protein